MAEIRTSLRIARRAEGRARTILRIRIQKSLVSNRMIPNLLARVVVGTTKEGKLRNHPNWNRSGLPWKESIFGKQFAAVKDDAWAKLPEHKMLTRDGKLVPYKRFKNLKIFSINLNNNVNNKQAATFTGLIDSGALFGGPYVDKNLADKLFSFIRMILK